jgi:hypothetical protein
MSDSVIDEQDVDTAELLDRRVGESTYRLAVARVGLTGQAPPVQLLYQAYRFGEVLGRRRRIHNPGQRGANVTQDNVGALAREGQRMRTTLTPGAAGDEYDLAIQSTHSAVLSVDYRVSGYRDCPLTAEP